MTESLIGRLEAVLAFLNESVNFAQADYGAPPEPATSFDLDLYNAAGTLHQCIEGLKQPSLDSSLIEKLEAAKSNDIDNWDYGYNAAIDAAVAIVRAHPSPDRFNVEPVLNLSEPIATTPDSSVFALLEAEKVNGGQEHSRIYNSAVDACVAIVRANQAPDRIAEELRGIVPNLFAWDPSLMDSESFQRLEAIAGFAAPGDDDASEISLPSDGNKLNSDYGSGGVEGHAYGAGSTARKPAEDASSSGVEQGRKLGSPVQIRPSNSGNQAPPAPASNDQPDEAPYFGFESLSPKAKTAYRAGYSHGKTDAAMEREYGAFHIERGEDGYETLVLHSVDETDTPEEWVRKERL